MTTSAPAAPGSNGDEVIRLQAVEDLLSDQLQDRCKEDRLGCRHELEGGPFRPGHRIEAPPDELSGPAAHRGGLDEPPSVASLQRTGSERGGGELAKHERVALAAAGEGQDCAHVDWALQATLEELRHLVGGQPGEVHPVHIALVPQPAPTLEQRQLRSGGQDNRPVPGGQLEDHGCGVLIDKGQVVNHEQPPPTHVSVHGGRHPSRDLDRQDRTNSSALRPHR